MDSMTKTEFVAKNLLIKAKLDESRAHMLLNNDAMSVACLKIALEELTEIVDNATNNYAQLFLAN